MSDASAAAGSKSAKRNTDSIVVIAMIMAFGLFELFALVVALPKFEDIFHGTLKGKPLPPITTILLDFRYAFVALAIFWMLIAVRTFQHRASSCLSYVLLTAASAQSAYTVIALFLPFIVTISAIS